MHIGHLYIIFLDMSTEVLCPFLKLGCSMFCCWVVGVIYIFYVLTFISCMTCEYFLQFTGCLLTVLVVSFDAHKSLSLMWSHLSILALIVCFLCHIQDITAKSSVMKIFPYIFFWLLMSFYLEAKSSPSVIFFFSGRCDFNHKLWHWMKWKKTVI